MKKWIGDYRNVFTVIALTGMALVMTHCMSTGSISVMKRLDRDLASYNALIVGVSAKKNEYKEYVHPLQNVMVKRFQDSNLFSKVSPRKKGAKGNLYLKMELVGVEEGSGFARAMNLGGEAEFTILCKLVDIKSKRVINTFEAKGNSVRQSKTSIGGVDTSWFDSLTGRAINAASIHVVEYMGKNMAPKKAKK